ncbi:MAG: glycosyl hydrolase family 18, partial [Candidatus Amulumruptor sp.]|nr:glycosyl hydrolase family 18 [Candidatus Amulumruptor sp.]
MKKLFSLALGALGLVAASASVSSCGSKASTEAAATDSVKPRIVVAYVTASSDVMPDPQAMTHINYA